MALRPVAQMRSCQSSPQKYQRACRSSQGNDNPNVFSGVDREDGGVVRLLKGQRTFGANGTPATWFDGAVVTME